MNAPEFKLPLVGLATSYCEFAKENPESGIRQLRGGLKRLLATALTPREFYIALELCDGHSYKDLAEKLDLSASRIAKQVQTIFSKLGINRKDQLAKFVW